MLQISNHPLYKKHNLDSAMSSFWEFYKGNFLYLFLVSLVMSLISKYISSFVGIEKLQAVTSDIQTLTDPAEMIELFKPFLVPMLIITISGLFFTCILQYLILVKPLEKENLFISIYKSLKYFIPYLIIVIILGFIGSFAFVIGLFMLVVGAIFAMIYILMISFFILPVLMVEGNNIGIGIARTAKLSHTNFWSNIGWSAVFFILLIIISLVLSNIILIPFAGNFIKTIVNPEDAGKLAVELATSPVYIILSSFVSAVLMPLMPIFGFIIYFNGRAREEVVQSPSYGEDTYKVRVEDLYAKPVHEEKEEGKS